MPFQENLSAFLVDWGEDMTIDGQPFRGIFGNPYTVDALGTPGMSTSRPQVLGIEADLPPRPASPDADSVLERANTFSPFRYYVREVLPDGTGMVSLQLEKHESQV
jgi:hypothetical protein